MSRKHTTSAVLAVLASLTLGGCPGDKKGTDDGHGHAEGESHAEEGGDDGHGHGDEGHGGHEEHEEGMVELTPSQLESAAIKVQTAGPGKIAEVLALNAVVGPDQDAQVHVTPKVPGVVREVSKGLGEQVQKGDALCELESVELGQAVSEYLRAQMLHESQRELLTQETRLLERSGALARTILDRQQELKEQGLSTVRNVYEAEQALAQTELERERRLLELGSTVRQLEVERVTARERLLILGLTAGDIEGLRAEEGAGVGRFTVRSAGSGVITARHVTLNEFVEPAATLFEIHDLSTVWVQGKVYEKDLRRVKTGQRALVRLNAFPGQVFEGKVSWIAFSIDPSTRAADVRVELPNGGPEWSEPFPIRPGMFGKVDIVVSERDAAVTLPEAAIVHEGDEAFVFVREAPAKFRRQPVQVAEGSEGLVEITRGLEAGAEVAVENTFTLKSMARAEELGGGHSH